MNHVILGGAQEKCSFWKFPLFLLLALTFVKFRSQLRERLLYYLWGRGFRVDKSPKTVSFPFCFAIERKGKGRTVGKLCISIFYFVLLCNSIFYFGPPILRLKFSVKVFIGKREFDTALYSVVPFLYFPQNAKLLKNEVYLINTVPTTNKYCT